MDPYSARLTGNPFLFFEMRIVADLIIQGLNGEEIKRQVREQNLFQYRTPKSIRKRVNAVLVRTDVLDKQLRETLAYGENQDAKLVALYSILKTDRLFFEFCIEVLRSKLLAHEQHIDQVDFRSFFSNKEEQSPVIARWKERTLSELRWVYTRVLIESGLLKRENGLLISPPVMASGLKNHLYRIGEEQFVLAMLGG